MMHKVTIPMTLVCLALMVSDGHNEREKVYAHATALQQSAENKKQKKLLQLQRMCQPRASDALIVLDPGVSFEIISPKEVIIPPHGTVNIDFELPTERYCIFDGNFILGGDGYVGGSVMYHNRGTVTVSNFKFNPMIIEKGFILGECFALKYQSFPTLERMEIAEIYEPGERPAEGQEKPAEEEKPSEASARIFEECLGALPKDLAEVIRPYRKMFLKKDPGDPHEYLRIPNVHIPIRLDAPSSMRPNYRHRYGTEKAKAFELWLQESIDSGLVEKSTSPISVPPLMVKKRSGKYRITLDFRKVNQACIRPITQAPVNDLLSGIYSLGSRKYHTCIDISGAFLSMGLSDVPQGPQSLSARDWCSFEYEVPGPYKGAWRFKAMPPGIACAPSMFNQVVNDMFADFPMTSQITIVCYYTDDLLISSDTWQEHLRDVNAVLSRLYRYNVKLDISKSQFGCTKIEYLGQLIEGGTIRTSPERTQVLDSVTCPNLKATPAEIEKKFQRLFGLCGTYRKYVKGYSAEEQAIRKAWKEALADQKNEETIRECEAKINARFDYVVKQIRQAVLVIPEPNAELKLMTDGSNTACGWALTTKQGRPVAFGGHMLSEVEKNYSTFEIEMMATVIGIEKCAPYIKLAKSVQVYSDNIANVLNLRSSDPANMSPRVMRFMMKIQDLTYGTPIEWLHLKGSLNLVADCISRFETMPTLEAHAVVTRSERSLKEKIEMLHRVTHCLSDRMILLLKENGIEVNRRSRELVEQVIDECSVCRVEKRLVMKKLIGKNKTPSREMEVFTIDHMEPKRSNSGNKYVFTCQDMFSKYIVAAPTVTKELSEVKPLLFQLKTCFPSIKTLRSDQAFESEGLRRQLRAIGVDLITGCAHNSLQNPVERCHRSIRECWKKISEREDYDCGDWEGPLSRAIEAVNAAPNMTTQMSPYKCVFGTSREILGESNEKRAMIRKMIFARIEKEKQKYATDLGIIPTCEIGQQLKVRYDPKAPPFYGEVVADQGLAVLLKRKAGLTWRKTRVHKKHCFVQIGSKESPLWKPEEFDQEIFANFLDMERRGGP